MNIGADFKQLLMTSQQLCERALYTLRWVQLLEKPDNILDAPKGAATIMFFGFLLIGPTATCTVHSQPAIKSICGSRPAQKVLLQTNACRSSWISMQLVALQCLKQYARTSKNNSRWVIYLFLCAAVRLLQNMCIKLNN